VDTRQRQKIEVSIWYEGEPLLCDKFKDDFDRYWSIEQLAFFLSKINLMKDSDIQEVELESSQWQAEKTVLVRPFLPKCEEGNVAEINQIRDRYNQVLTFANSMNIKDAEFLTFELAVPFASNHQNPLTQPSPLNMPSMFWSWRTGHKFLRLDLNSPESTWAFHLGSVGCDAASSMRSPSRPCSQPHRIKFKLAKIWQGKRLVMHLDKLVAGIEMAKTGSCLFHGNAEKNCSKLLMNLKVNNVFEWY
jgi:uncharacterized repeat protein (TIGR04052 family)